MPNINDIVNEELKSIPRGDRGSDQNRFIASFNMQRRADLSIDPNTPVIESVRKAINGLRPANPNWFPKLDEPLASLSRELTAGR